jgi:SNF2 family DNA or RNA helicase
MEHQKRGVEITRKHKRFAFYFAPGVGKTIMMLAAIVDAKANGFTGKVIVLAPKSILSSAWGGDAKHFPQLKTLVVWANNASKRKALIAAGADVYITNPETFKAHVADFYNAGVRWLIVDESSKIKAHDTKITKICIDFARCCERVNLLSGTPAPNGPHEYISQLQCIDLGTFHTGSFYGVANHYFVPIKRTIGGKERIIGWRFNKLRERDFMEKLHARSWALSRDECIDLPGEQDIVREVVLSPEEATAYISMVDELRLELAGEQYKINPQAKLMKLRQLTSGLIYLDGERHHIGTAKLDALADLLDEIGSEQAVIWCEFKSEIEAITELLNSRGAKFGRVFGEVSLDQRTQNINQFQAGELQYLICHPAAAGHGITLTAAAIDIFFSLSFSYEQHEQARCRIYRKGQTRKVVHYYLLSVGTVDGMVRECLGGKRDASEVVLKYLRMDTDDAAGAAAEGNVYANV